MRAWAACRRDILTMALEKATLAGPMIVRTCSFTRSSACHPPHSVSQCLNMASDLAVLGTALIML